MGHCFLTRFFPDNYLTANKIPDMFQIPWHFQVFLTSGHPTVTVYVSRPVWATDPHKSDSDSDPPTGTDSFQVAVDRMPTWHLEYQTVSLSVRHHSSQSVSASCSHITCKLFLTAILSAVQIFENSNNYFTIWFDLKRIQLFKIFKYLSYLHTAIFGNYNGNATNCRRLWRL